MKTPQETSVADPPIAWRGTPRISATLGYIHVESMIVDVLVRQRRVTDGHRSDSETVLSTSAKSTPWGVSILWERRVPTSRGKTLAAFGVIVLKILRHGFV